MTPKPLSDLLNIARQATGGLSHFDPLFNIRRVEWVAREIEGTILPNGATTSALRDLRGVTRRISDELSMGRGNLDDWRAELNTQIAALEVTLADARPNQRTEILGIGG